MPGLPPPCGAPSTCRTARAPGSARTGHVRYQARAGVHTWTSQIATGRTPARSFPRPASARRYATPLGPGRVRPLRRASPPPRPPGPAWDPPRARVRFPPSYQARLLADEGVTAWAGINCRDRNRVAIEGEIAACADAGVAGVHCVTGDHPGTGHRPDAAAVFDLDSIELVGLASTAGALAARP